MDEILFTLREDYRTFVRRSNGKPKINNPSQRENRLNGLCYCGNEPVKGKVRCQSCLTDSTYNARKHSYGITRRQFDYMLLVQNNRCAICNTEFTKVSKNTIPHVDHSHSIDQVRGLLCHKCNVTLGNVDDNITILLNAISYLMHYQEKLEKETINGSN